MPNADRIRAALLDILEDGTVSAADRIQAANTLIRLARAEAERAL